MRIEIEQEQGGRWIAEVLDISKIMTYGLYCTEAISKVESLALLVMADRLGHGEEIPELLDVFTV